jgi:hypothetical protein
MTDLCEHYNFPIRIIDIQGIELYSHPAYKYEKDSDKTIVMSTEE